MTELTPDSMPALASGHRLQFEPSQDAWVLLYPEGMVQLNTSAAEILKLCDGTRTLTQVVAALEFTFQVKGIEPEVRALIAQGMSRGWIV
jgi:pyrroloquinoline quinone biosynthesis protein D